MNFTVAGGTLDSGVVVGNKYDKYNTRNPIAQRIMRGFDSSLSELVAIARPQSIHDVGCGEGYWTLRWLEQGYQVKGSDFSSQAIEIARRNAANRGLSEQTFSATSIYDLDPSRDGADLIVCCEVLEHVESPKEAIAALKAVTREWLIVSVPREPLWRILNIARGQYLSDLGNTPGHIQHWSKSSFIDLVGSYFGVKEIRSPLPWTMLLCRKA